jgi:hypothetical protein
MVDILNLSGDGSDGGDGDNNGGDDLATPDELLMELLDLVALSFPSSVTQWTLTFIKNDEGKKPALSDMSANAPADAVKRPALGHTDAEVLDTINHLLAELGDATFRQGKVRVLAGSLTAHENADAGVDVTLAENVDGVSAPVMTRTFDASELRARLYTRQLFARLNESSADEAVAGERLDRALKGTTRFDIDMKKGMVTFTGPEREPSPWRFELLGSWLEDTGHFMWGWANDQVDPKMTRRVEAIRQAATGPGLRAFADAALAGPESFFSRLCRSAGAQMSAFGVYRAPFRGRQGKGVMFLALFSA